MVRLRTTLGILLVMIGLVLASQPAFVGSLLSSLGAAGQGDDSDGSPASEVVLNLDCLQPQKRISLSVSLLELEKSLPGYVAKAAPEENLVRNLSLPSSCLISEIFYIGQSGLQPRAPSLA